MTGGVRSGSRCTTKEIDLMGNDDQLWEGWKVRPSLWWKVLGKGPVLRKEKGGLRRSKINR